MNMPAMRPEPNALHPVPSLMQLDSAGIEALEAHAEELLPSIATEEVHVVPLSSGSSPHVSIIADPDIAQRPPSIPSSAIEETLHAIEAGDAVALAGDVVDAVTGSGIGAAQASILTRVRAITFVCASKLPIVGSYFVDSTHDDASNVELATETTPLLGALHDPKAFVTGEAEGLLLRLFSPLLRRVPDVDALDNESDNSGLLFKTLIECYVLAIDGGRWLFTHLQEHSLVVAPTISLGHLSTTDLAASTIGMAVSSVTGYSIIQGFVSSLDQVLAKAPDRRVATISCTQVAVVTGVILFPITNLWSFHSATLLQRLGQSPEVAVPAAQFLQITAAGLPGYAIGEIAKRYLTSQGLSNVHTRILSAAAPLNLLLNYLLVDGPIPALRMGFAGAPLCTVLSHNALAILMVIYIVQRAMWEEVEHLRDRNVVPDEPQRDAAGGEQSQNYSEATFFTGLGVLLFAGVSGVSKSASQLWSKDFGGVVASILGPDALATQAILLTTATTLYQAPKALGNASSDRIKKWLAKGDVQRAKITAFVAFLGTLAEAIIIRSILLACATSWGKLFNSDPVILQNVSVLLPFISMFQVVHGIGAWADNSLGALGKTAVFPSLNASADYVLGIPLGVYLALTMRWGLSGLWLGLTLSLTFSCLVATVVLVRTNWGRSAAAGERVRGENTSVEEVGNVQSRVGRTCV